MLERCENLIVFRIRHRRMSPALLLVFAIVAGSLSMINRLNEEVKCSHILAIVEGSRPCGGAHSAATSGVVSVPRWPTPSVIQWSITTQGRPGPKSDSYYYVRDWKVAKCIDSGMNGIIAMKV